MKYTAVACESFLTQNQTECRRLGLSEKWSDSIKGIIAINTTVQNAIDAYTEFATSSSSRDCSVYHFPEKIFPSVKNVLAVDYFQRWWTANSRSPSFV
jgi:hypothetical protein